MKFNLGNYWLKSGLINIVQNISGQVLNLLSFYFLVRLLTKDEFGAWAIYMQTIVVFELVRNGLIQSALIKFLSGSDIKEHSKIVTAAFSISSVITVACVIINLSFASYFSKLLNAPLLESIFYLYNIVFLLSGLLTQLCCIEQANLQYKGVFVSNVLRQFCMFIFPMYCYFLNRSVSLEELVWAQLVGIILSLLGSWFYVKRFFNFRISFDKSWLMKIYNYGKFSFGTSVSAQLSNTLDQWMLAGLLSPASSASFNIAVRVTNLINVPTDAVATIVFPQSSRRMQTDGPDAIRYLYEKSVGTIMAILIPAVLFVYIFNDQIINLLAGDKYEDAVPLLNITLMYCLLIPYGRQFGTILDSIGKTRITFITVLITASLNLTLNYILITHMGLIGAAYATLIANVAGFGFAQYILYRELRINLFHTLIYAWRFYPEFINKYILKRGK